MVLTKQPNFFFGSDQNSFRYITATFWIRASLTQICPENQYDWKQLNHNRYVHLRAESRELETTLLNNDSNHIYFNSTVKCLTKRSKTGQCSSNKNTLIKTNK